MNMKTRGADIYRKAENNGCYLDCTCVDCGRFMWDELMKGSVKADRVKATKIAQMAGVISIEQAKTEINKPYYNPYRHLRTKTHVIYVHSGIEYFIKVNQ